MALDDAAAAGAEFDRTQREFQNAEMRRDRAMEDFEQAQEELWAAQDDAGHWEYQFGMVNSNEEWEHAKAMLDEANERLARAEEWFAAAETEQGEAETWVGEAETMMNTAETGMNDSGFDPDFEYPDWSNWTEGDEMIWDEETMRQPDCTHSCGDDPETFVCQEDGSECPAAAAQPDCTHSCGDDPETFVCTAEGEACPSTGDDSGDGSGDDGSGAAA